MNGERHITPQQEQLLTFLGGGEGEIDPLRIMKGLFIFSQEAPEEWAPRGDRYTFVPYDYGPCSFDIYRDLDRLEALGYVASSEVPWRSWKTYKLTRSGRELRDRAALGEGAREYLSRVREFVTSLGFDRLLRAIYGKYPDYAVNSVFGR